MVKAVMNAVYLAIGIAFARKIYEKACSDPYEGLKSAAREYRKQQLNILVGEPKHPMSIPEILKAANSVSISKSRIVPDVPMFPSTPKLGNPWDLFPWSPKDKEL